MRSTKRGRASLWTVAAAMAVLLAAPMALVAHDVGPAAADPVNQTVTFTHTGTGQQFLVPAGVTNVTIEAWGAQGDSANGGAGRGGYIRSLHAVVPGTRLHVFVGSGGSLGVPGFNGGGDADSGNPADPVGGGGGGMSDVRQGSTSFSDVIVVAGGGGGGGTDGNGTPGRGGDGGLPNGNSGGDGFSSASGGGGGTAASGGVGRRGGTNGTAGQGGTGAETGGGGGGGWFGGGGGGATSDLNAGGGGGGGSSFTRGVLLADSTGARTGNGLVTISWVGPPPSPSGPWPSDDCDGVPGNVTVLAGFVGPAYVKLRTAPDPALTGDQWVCVAAEAAGVHVGGKIVLVGGSPIVPVGIDFDDPAQPESSRPSAQCDGEPGTIELVDLTVLDEPVWLHVTPTPTGPTEVAWVCVRLRDTIGFRLRVTTLVGIRQIELDPFAPHDPPYS